MVAPLEGHGLCVRTPSSGAHHVCPTAQDDLDEAKPEGTEWARTRSWDFCVTWFWYVFDGRWQECLSFYTSWRLGRGKACQWRQATVSLEFGRVKWKLKICEFWITSCFLWFTVRLFFIILFFLSRQESSHQFFERLQSEVPAAPEDKIKAMEELQHEQEVRGRLVGSKREGEPWISWPPTRCYCFIRCTVVEFQTFGKMGRQCNEVVFRGRLVQQRSRR